MTSSLITSIALSSVYYFWGHIQAMVAQTSVEKAMFSSSGFTVSGLRFKSLIQFELLFVYGVMGRSSFTLLHVVQE